MRHLRLGASLYVPATRPDLVEIGNRRKHSHLRSVIFCTEDAIRPADVPRALDQLDSALAEFEDVELLRFVRVRNPEVLRMLLTMADIRKLDGFVLPKVTHYDVDSYMSAFSDDDNFEVMITLETIQAFDPAEMRALRDRLTEPRHRRRVLSLRIGGNDLLNLLGIRRPRDRTVYSTPLGATIAQLAGAFLPHEFNLTGPVFEYLGLGKLLTREVNQDLRYGLFGKTAIHPAQVATIEDCYRVNASDLEMAESILADQAPAVFKLHDAMCEPAVHRRWALTTCERAAIYGVVGRTRRHSVLGAAVLD